MEKNRQNTQNLPSKPDIWLVSEARWNIPNLSMKMYYFRRSSQLYNRWFPNVVKWTQWLKTMVKSIH